MIIDYLEKVFKSYQFTIEALVAFGTIATAIFAFYFGIFGNYETRLLLRKKEKELDQEAFIFLTEIPNFGYLGRDEFIKEFESKIIESVFVSAKKQKKYRLYIKLAEKFDSFDPKNVKIFNQIKSEIIKLSKEASRRSLTFLQKFYKFEAKCYVEKNIFLIPSEFSFSSEEKKMHPSVLLYSDNYTTSDQDSRYENDIQHALQLINADFKRKNIIQEGDNYYSDIQLSDCKILYPADDYELIKRNDKKIEIKYKSKIIELYYNKPRSYKDLEVAD